MKKFVSVLKRTVSLSVVLTLVLGLMCTTAVFAARTYDASVYILGTKVGFENAPYESGGVIYVPLEEICEYLNLDCEKQPSDMFKISRGSTEVIIQSGNMICKKDGQSVTLPGQPRVKNSVVYIPVDALDICFGMPVTKDIATRYAEITPNVYKIFIDEKNAAAVSVSSPDFDTLNTGSSAKDELYTFAPKAAETDKSLFYKFDLSQYKGQKIGKAELVVNAGRGGNWYPHIEVARTESWEKASINYNNQPEVLAESFVVGKAFGTQYQVNATTMYPSRYAVTQWAISAIDKNEPLALKLMGVPYDTSGNPSSPQVYISGVNTENRAYLEITVDEQYRFPTEKEVHQSDVDRNTFDAMSLLKKLGIIEEGEEFPSDLSEGITRGEFLKYAMRLYSDSLSVSGGEKVFEDVPADSAYFGFVSAAVSKGVVSAEKGGLFRPDEPIAYNEAIAIVGNMLGYGIYANSRGGFPGGYLNAAQTAKLLKNVRMSDIFGFDSTFVLLLNTLGAPTIDVTVYNSNGNAEYKFNENETFLSKYWDAYKLEGRVTGNEYTDIDPSKAGASEKLSIDGKRVRIDDSQYNSLLGYRVTAYCTNDDDKVLYIGAEQNKENIEKIDLSSVTAVNETGNEIELTYDDEKGKSEKEIIKKSYWVIYNGKTVPAGRINERLFDAQTGEAVILNDNTAIITAYETVVVNSVDVENEVIADEYDVYDKAIRLENTDYYDFRNDAGDSISLDAIRQNDVISVAKSLDGKIITGQISRRVLNAKLEGISDKGTPDCKITLNGSEYKLVNQNSKWTELMSFGKTGTYLIDSFGNIAGYIDVAGNSKLGYIIEMMPKGGLSRTIEVAVNVADIENYVIYELAEKVNIDGDNYSSIDEIIEYFTDSEAGKIKKQGIVFDVNSEGKINKIDTSALGEKENIQNTLCLRYTYDQPALLHKGGRFGDLYYVNLDKALAVCIPEDEEDLDEYESIESGIANESDINADIYTIGNRKPDADILVMKSESASAATVNEFAQLSLVSRIKTALDEDDEVIKILYLYNASDKLTNVTVPYENISLLEGINPGDLVRIGTDRKNELGAIKEYYDYETKQIVDNSRYDASYFNYNIRLYGGYVVDKMGSYVKFTNDLADTREENYRWFNFEGETKLFKYDVEQSEAILSLATPADMIDYNHMPYSPSGVIIQTRYATQYIAGYIIELAKPANTGVYKVKFAAGEGASGTAPDFIRADAGDAISLPANTFVRPEYDFEGWVTDGDSHVYLPGESYIVGGDALFYAKWTYVGRQYSINFSGGEGASGTMTNLSSSAGKSVTLPENLFTKPGNKFMAWSDGSNQYQPGDSFIVPESDVTFTAVWFKCWDSTVAETQPSTKVINGETYYEIADGRELAWFANKVNGGETAVNAVLTDDIYLNYGGEYTANWRPFSIGKTVDTKFSGKFDGAGFTIYGLYSNDKYTYQGGLFGYIGSGGMVSNVTLKETRIEVGLASGQCYAGAIASQNDGVVKKCSAYGEVVSVDGGKLDGAAGLIGLLSGTVSECYSGMNITSDAGFDSASGASAYNSGVGGIAAKAKGAFTIDKCGNGGTINVPKLYQVGGIAGLLDPTGATFGECYNTGNITAGWRTGGIFGFVPSSTVIGASLYNTGNIESKNTYAAGLFNNGKEKAENHASYSTGTVKAALGKENYAGLLYTYDTNYAYNYFDTNFIYPASVEEGVNWTIGLVTCGNGVGTNRGTGKTLSEIRTQATVDILNGWTGANTFKLDAGKNEGFPVFTWQN